ncbi:hypothetical protein Tco_1382314, partial [Tanacetum coccineum]
ENTNFSLNKYTPSNNVTAGYDEASDEQPIMHSSKTEVQASAETSFEPRKAEIFNHFLTL